MEVNTLFDDFSAVINETGYWSSFNNGVLPKAIRALQEALELNPSIESIRKVAHEWQQETVLYNPTRYFTKFPYIRKLLKAIVETNIDDATILLSAVKKNIKNYLNKNIADTYESLNDNLLRQLELVEGDANRRTILEDAAANFLKRGKLYINTNRQLALNCLERVLELSEDNDLLFQAHYELGYLLKDSKDALDEALQHFKTAGELSDTTNLSAIQQSRAFFQYAQSLYSLGIDMLTDEQLGGVIQSYGMALQIRPDYLRAQAALQYIARNTTQAGIRDAISEFIDITTAPAILHGYQQQPAAAVQPTTETAANLRIT